MGIFSQTVVADLEKNRGGSVFGLCDGRVVRSLCANVLAAILGVVDESPEARPQDDPGWGGVEVEGGRGSSQPRSGGGVEKAGRDQEGGGDSTSAPANTTSLEVEGVGRPSSGNKLWTVSGAAQQPTTLKTSAGTSEKSGLESITSDSSAFRKAAENFLESAEEEDAARFRIDLSTGQMIEGVYLVRRLFGRERTREFQRAGIIPRAAWRLLIKKNLPFCQLRTDPAQLLRFHEEMQHQDQVATASSVDAAQLLHQYSLTSDASYLDNRGDMQVVGYSLSGHQAESKRKVHREKLQRSLTPVGELDAYGQDVGIDHGKLEVGPVSNTPLRGEPRGSSSSPRDANRNANEYGKMRYATGGLSRRSSDGWQAPNYVEQSLGGPDVSVPRRREYFQEDGGKTAGEANDGNERADRDEVSVNEEVSDADADVVDRPPRKVMSGSEEEREALGFLPSQGEFLYYAERGTGATSAASGSSEGGWSFVHPEEEEGCLFIPEEDQGRSTIRAQPPPRKLPIDVRRGPRRTLIGRLLDPVDLAGHEIRGRLGNGLVSAGGGHAAAARRPLEWEGVGAAPTTSGRTRTTQQAQQKRRNIVQNAVEKRRAATSTGRDEEIYLPLEFCGLPGSSDNLIS